LQTCPDWLPGDSSSELAGQIAGPLGRRGQPLLALSGSWDCCVYRRRETEALGGQEASCVTGQQGRLETAESGSLQGPCFSHLVLGSLLSLFQFLGMLWVSEVLRFAF
jgi:hypothetical protein